MKAVTADQMRAIERTAPVDLMEQAGTRAAREISLFLATLPARARQRLVVCCGPGNNGGDGFVIAREFQRSGELPCVLVYMRAPEKLSGDAARHAQSADWRIPLIPFEKFDGFLPGDVIVDAILGTGVTGDVRGCAAQFIEAVNASHAPVIAVDVPSGINADTGEAVCAVHADRTLTIGRPKTGLFATPYSGTIYIVPLDGLEDSVAASGPDVFTECEARVLLTRLDHHAHKNSRGRLLVIAGSKLYSGAPQLLVREAFRVGCSMLRLAVPPAAEYPHLPLATVCCHVDGEPEGFFSNASFPELQILAAQSDAVAIGSGMGNRPGMEQLLARLFALPQKLLLDADALNVLAGVPQLWRIRREASCILTPHKGELKRLCNSMQIPEDAKLLSQKIRQLVVDKGPHTTIYAPNGRFAINLSGNAALATAGSGDILSGAIAGFMSCGIELFDAACLGVFVHGRAADLWRGPRRALTADDLPGLTMKALREIAPIC